MICSTKTLIFQGFERLSRAHAVRSFLFIGSQPTNCGVFKALSTIYRGQCTTCFLLQASASAFVLSHKKSIRPEYAKEKLPRLRFCSCGSIIHISTKVLFQGGLPFGFPEAYEYAVRQNGDRSLDKHAI